MEGTAVMAVMIPREIIDEIVYRSDIEQVIGSYVTLKRAGSNFNGLCPFHNEKTPSFTVFPATKSFYCFGCGAGGDVITFIMREENLDYREAVEFLAAKAGISIPEDNSVTENKGVPRKRIYEMNLAAAKFFRECLFDSKLGGEAMKYLHEDRKLSMATIKHFGLGFSPNNAWALTNHMHRLGFTDEELTEGFLCGKSRNSGKTYDYYRNRVIFPIIDTSGNIVAFGGRVMDDSKPKYLNTSDTRAFKKSRHLFALNYAKKHCEEQMILCEGYMDVIALHSARFENAVATPGTAITPEQARIFAKYTKKVIICYDSDNAGQTAASKAIRYLGEVGVYVKVLKLTGAKDPDEYIKKYSTDSFRRVLEESKTSFEFKLEKIVSAYNITLPEEKIKAAAEVSELISNTSSRVEREIYIRRASELLGVSSEAMESDVNRLAAKKARESKKKEFKDATLEVKNIGDRVNMDAAKHFKASAAEEGLLGLLLIFDEFRHEIVGETPIISADDFSTGFGRRVFEVIAELEASESGFSKAMLGQYFTPDEMGRIEKMEVDRSRLARNGREVFLELVENVKNAKSDNASDTNLADDLAKMRERLQKQKKNKNT